MNERMNERAGTRTKAKTGTLRGAERERLGRNRRIRVLSLCRGRAALIGGMEVARQNTAERNCQPSSAHCTTTSARTTLSVHP